MLQAATPTIIIQPSQGWMPLNLKSIWEYRELLFFFIIRDIKIRYRKTVLGGAWAVIQPFVTMVVFSIFFGWLIKVPSDGLPYPLFAYSALLPWQLFASILSVSSNSLVANENLITKVYSPRLLIPVAASAVALLDFAVASVMLLGMLLFYGVVPTNNIWLLPFYVMLALVTALGVGAWLSAINVRYRDIRYALPFLTQLWLFATPVVYPSSLVPPSWRTLYALNPMVSVVEGCRGALLGTSMANNAAMLMTSVLVSVAVFFSGLYYFRRMERTFADVV